MRATRPALVSAALIALTAASVGGVFVALVTGDDPVAPPGFDTPKYVWRANLVAGQGLAALEGSSPYPEHADRPGYPVLAALLRSVIGISAFELGFTLPAAVAILVALGAGTLAVVVLGEPRWTFAVYGVVVGMSVNVVLTASGLIDNLVLDAVVLAAAVGALCWSTGAGGLAMTLVLVGAGALIHWPLTGVFLGILAMVAVTAIPTSVAGRRRGRPPGDTPAARLGTLVGAAAVVVVAALAALGVPLQAPRTDPTAFVAKLGRFVPRLHLPVVAPAAALGIPALAFPGDPLRRRGLILALAWALMAAVAVPLLVVLGVEIPAHRLLVFALGIPILAAAAVAAAGRLLARVPPRALGAALAAAVVLGGAAASAWLARASWADRARVKFPVPGLVQARAAGRYLSEVGNRRPVVFIVNPRTGAARVGQASALSFGVIRAALPSGQIALAHIYLGRPADLAAERPSLEDDRRYNEASRAHWAAVRPLLADDAVVLYLSAFNEGLRGAAPGGDAVARGVRVVRGPAVDGPRTLPDPPRPPTTGSLVSGTAAVLALLWAIGAGWSVALVPGGLLPRAALAPVLGLAAAVIAGTAAGRLGVDTAGTRPSIAAATALAGWAIPAVRWARGRSRGDGPGSAGTGPSATVLAR